MGGKPNAPAAERNAAAILEVLRTELDEVKTVLEIGSGTGQHAVAFGRALRHLTWQTSDLEDNHPAIRSWIAHDGPANVLAPLSLDVMTNTVPADQYDAVFAANTAHIMSYTAVERMLEIVAKTLRKSGRFCLYGPFREAGEFNTESNAAFHRSLVATNPDMGLRDLEDLDQWARAGAMRRVRRYAMPANNLLVVWQKDAGDLDNGR